MSFSRNVPPWQDKIDGISGGIIWGRRINIFNKMVLDFWGGGGLQYTQYETGKAKNTVSITSFITGNLVLRTGISLGFGF